MFGVLIIVFIILAATPAGFPFKKDVAAQRYYVLVNFIGLFRLQIIKLEFIPSTLNAHFTMRTTRLQMRVVSIYNLSSQDTLNCTTRH